VLRPHYQVAKPLSLPLADLPVLIGLGIAELFEGKAAVLELLRVDQVDVGAITRIFKPLGLLLDVHQYVFVEVGRTADLQLLNPGVEEPVYLLLCVSEEVGRGGLEEDALVGDEEVDVIGEFLLEVWVRRGYA